MDKCGYGLFLILCAVSETSTQGGGGGGGSPPSYSTILESTLRTELFKDYEVLQRPQERVTVAVSFNVITINSLNIKDQALSTSGYFSMKWSDSRLAWASNSNYTNIRFLFSNENYMWTPAVIVENSVTNMVVISDEKTLMRINTNGQINWTPGGIYVTNCEADVTYYPLDTQICSIILSTWAYTSNEVALEFDTDGAILMSHFTENGEWEIISTTNSSTTGSRESQSFSRLYFTFKLRRRPLFHILNTLFPVILMASLTIFVFKLPPDSGERIGMSLTVLLAYAVYLTLISGNIPQTSTSASILSTYLTIILMMSALSVVFTIFVLDVYFNSDEEEVPGWLQTFTHKILVRVACWNITCCKRKQIKPTDNDTDILTKGSNKLKIEEHVVRTDKIGSLILDPSGKEKSAHKRNKLKQSENVGAEKQYSWKEIALLMDRCFLIMFILLVLIASVICLALLVSAST